MEEAIQSSIYVSSPDFASWLQKRGFHWRKLWKRRWVSVNGAEIMYMDKEPSPDNIKTINISKATITGATIVREDDDPEGSELGFSINLNDGQQPPWYLRAESVREKKNWVIRIGYVIAIVRWLESFEKVRVLGVGGSGIVYELLHKSNGQSFALKEIEIKSEKQRNMAISEAETLKDIMENVAHPNILHIEKVFQVGSKFYLVFPLCRGGELYEHIVKRGHFTEHDAAVIVHDLVSGLHALHQHQILHLDIKPENILFDKMGDDAKIKLTDFGISRIIASGKERVKAKDANKSDFNLDLFLAKVKDVEETGALDITHVKGTIGYMSPELILMNYCSKAADVFAAGVILYILLCGRPPFPGENDRMVLENTAKGKFYMGSRWKSISDDVKDLIEKMLCRNPLERISCEDIMKHPWIQQVEEPVDVLVDTLVQLNTSATPNSAADSSSLRPQSPVPMHQRSRMTASNAQHDLHDTLKLLTKHVSQIKTQKMATNITRLVSIMNNKNTAQVNPEANKTLSELFLKPAKDFSYRQSSVGDMSSSSAAAAGNPSDVNFAADFAEQVRDEEVLAVLNTDVRDALMSIIERLTRQNRNKAGSSRRLDSMDSSFQEDDDEDEEDPNTEPGITLEQFLLILRNFQFVPETNAGVRGNRHNVGALLFARFLDRDSDGIITLDDMLTTQALMMQRGEAFLRMVFRIYTETAWYPGRQINYRSLINMVGRGGDSSDFAQQASTSGKGRSIMSSGEEEVRGDVVEPPKFITARNVTTAFEKLGYDSTYAAKVFQLLCERVAKLKKYQSSLNTATNNANLPSELIEEPEDFRSNTQSTNSTGNNNLERDSFFDNSNSLPSQIEEDSERSRENRRSKAVEELTGAIASSFEDASNINDEENEEEAAARYAAEQDQGQNSNMQLKMDVQEFIQACRMDDVLIQAILRKPRQYISKIVRRATKKAEESRGLHPVSYYVEEELWLAITESSANNSRKSIAATVGTTLSAAFGFASKVAQSFKHNASNHDISRDTILERESVMDDEFFDCVEDDDP